MASGDIIVKVADKTTLDGCHEILKDLKALYDTGLTSNDLSEMEAPATADHVLSGKTFYSENNVLKTGMLPAHADANINYDDEEKVINPGSDKDILYIPIKRGAYTHASPDIMVTKKAIAEAVSMPNETSDKIVAGNMILGVKGTGLKLVASGMVASGGNGESAAKWSCCRSGFADETYFTKTVESSTISIPTTANRHQVVFTCNKTGTYRFRGHAFAYKGDTNGDVGLCRSRVVKNGTEKLLVTSTTGDTIDSFDFTESMTSGYTFRIQTDTYGTSKEDDGWLAAVYATIELAL